MKVSLAASAAVIVVASNHAYAQGHGSSSSSSPPPASTSWAATAGTASSSPPPAASASPAPTGALTTVIPPVHTTTLANGMTVVLSPQRNTARAIVVVDYHVGYRDDPAGYQGLAHTLEHMMFRGTRHVPGSGFTERLESAGASLINAGTERDRTTYYETIPAEQLPVALWLEADRMAFGADAFVQESLDRERRAVLNEHSLRVSGVPGGALSYFANQALYPVGHPYRDAFEFREDVAAIAPDHLAWFFQTYYEPRNATLIVTGNFDEEATLAMVRQYFEPIANHAPPRAFARPQRVPRAGPMRIAIATDSQMRRVRISWPTPRWLARGDAALDVASGMLGGDPESRLAVRLLDGRRATDLDVGQASHELSSEFVIDTYIAATSTPDEILQIVDAEIERLAYGPIDEQMLDDWRDNFALRLRLMREDPAQRAFMLARYATLGGDADGFDRDIQRYEAVTTDDVRAAVRRYLSSNARIVEVTTTRTGAPTQGEIISRTVGR